MPNLINSAADLKANFGSISGQFTWPNVSSFAADVERDIIGDAIGPEALAWFQGNLTVLVDIPAKALVYLQRSVSYLTILKYSQTALFQFEDKALYLAKTTNGAIPSDKKLTDLRRYCGEEGFKYLDKAIDLMESNLASFTQYRDSGTRQTLNQGFIKTAVDFSKYRNINNSRLTFLSMFYFMIDIQEDKLPDYMTPEYYALFKERYLDDELNPDELKLLPYIKKAVAMYTIGLACTRMAVQLDNGGFYVNQYLNHTDYNMQEQVTQSRLQYMADDHQDKGLRCLQQLQDYIVANAGLLPGYVPPTVVPDVEVHHRKSGIFNPM